MSDPRTFFESMVKPAYTDWYQQPLAEHRAKAAIAFANDMAERMFHHLNLKSAYGRGRAGIAAYRDHLAAAECADFGLVRDIADGTKHFRLSRPNRRITSAQQTSRQTVTIDKIEYLVDDIPDWDSSEALVVDLDDGSRRTLLGIMHNVFDMWERLLKSYGL